MLFYCHFPDKLLCVDRRSFIKRLYRWPLDWLEEITTGPYLTPIIIIIIPVYLLPNLLLRLLPHFSSRCSPSFLLSHSFHFMLHLLIWCYYHHYYYLTIALLLLLVVVGASTAIAVNSNFTAGIFKEAFTRIGPQFQPVVLYPAINLDSFVEPATTTGGDIGKRSPIEKLHVVGGTHCSPNANTPPNSANVFWVCVPGPIVSLNRFERKKNIGLALEAFSLVLQRLQDKPVAKNLQLIVAGSTRSSSSWWG